MSNRDNEKDYSDMTNALQFVFNQFIKDIFISIPGIIQSYNSTTKRCRVKPAINIRKTDGSSFSPSEIVNVPVLWPGGGGFVLLSLLQKGDPVEIKFSQRGITKFKEGFLQADPGNGMFDKEDAHVITGYGSLEVTPATGSGISIQDEAGTNYVFVEDGNVEIKAGTEVKVIAPTATIEADDAVIDSTNAEINATKIDLNAANINANGILNVSGIVNANGGLGVGGGSDIDVGASIIKGANVFNGPDSDKHHHPQGPDSASDTQQDTGDPKS